MTLLLKSLSITLILTGLTAFQTNAALYSTLTSGTWDNTTNVWSLDGSTPCGCTPGPSTSGDDIRIIHDIVMSYNISIDGGSSFTLSNTGSLTGGSNISIMNANLQIYGAVNIGKFDMDGGGFTNIYPGVVMTLSNRLDIDKGVFTIDGSVINSGGMVVHTNGVLITLNASKITVVSGNLSNYGTIDICEDCCLASNGNWKNQSSGTVTGMGSAFSGGNINNSGNWDINIVWCSNGGDIGMPSPENCLDANSNCGAIVLPVELVEFDAEIINNSYSLITWATVSETNNDYFKVMKTQDGVNWTQIDIVQGAGSSIRMLYYSTEDYNLEKGTTYYQLIQVDFDGEENYSNIISVEREFANSKILLFPNPSASSKEINIINLANDRAAISISNSSGRIVIQREFDRTDSSLKMDISDLNPGIYFVNVQQGEKKSTNKLVVTK
jgi:hypothetical protein